MTLERVCVICSKKLNIKINTDKSYSGGHFFGDKDEKDPKNEYWECDSCYEDWD